MNNKYHKKEEYKPIHRGKYIDIEINTNHEENNA